MKWKLVSEKTGEEIAKFPVTIQRENDKMTVIGGQPPRHGGSSGRIYTSDNREYYPNVAGLKWVDEYEVKFFVIEECYVTNGTDFTDHMITKAKTDDEAHKKWCESYGAMTSDAVEVDAGDYTIKFEDIKEIDENEYDILNKYFKEI
jgi:hypothetical protein